MRFGGQAAMIQGAQVDATKCGCTPSRRCVRCRSFRPVQAFDQLQASLSERSVPALKLYQDAVNGSGSTATRCEQLKQSKEPAQQHPWKPHAQGRGPEFLLVSGPCGPEHWAAMYLGEDGHLGDALSDG